MLVNNNFKIVFSISSLYVTTKQKCFQKFTFGQHAAIFFHQNHKNGEGIMIGSSDVTKGKICGTV